MDMRKSLKREILQCTDGFLFCGRREDEVNGVFAREIIRLDVARHLGGYLGHVCFEDNLPYRLPAL